MNNISPWDTTHSDIKLHKASGLLCIISKENWFIFMLPGGHVQQYNGRFEGRIFEGNIRVCEVSASLEGGRGRPIICIQSLQGTCPHILQRFMGISVRKRQCIFYVYVGSSVSPKFSYFERTICWLASVVRGQH